MRSVLFALPLTVAFAGAALAQSTVAPAPNAPAPGAPGAPGVAAPTTNATGSPAAGSYSPTGRPADAISNDSSAAGNAGQPSRVAPQGGGGSSR
jgi:hypothetical protein